MMFRDVVVIDSESSTTKNETQTVKGKLISYTLETRRVSGHILLQNVKYLKQYILHGATGLQTENFNSYF
jgi:predicted Ser/Thr protein kinase